MKSARAILLLGCACVAIGCGGGKRQPAADAAAVVDAASEGRIDVPGAGVDAGVDAPVDRGMGVEAGAGEVGVGDVDGGDVDVGVGDVAADVRPGVACTQASQCAGQPAPDAGRWCGSSAWSCLDGRCTWECQHARSCTRDAKGCLSCAGIKGVACPGDPCVVPPRPGEEVESTTCPIAHDRSEWTCFGGWARLADGTLCSVQDLATGAVRFVVSCGTCQTVIRQ